MASLWTWFPDWQTIRQDLAIVPIGNDKPTEWLGMKMRWAFTGSFPWFDGLALSEATSHHWEIPITATTLYFIMILTLKWAVKKYGKWNVKSAAFYWNAFLSIFSWFGVFACVPVLVLSLMEHGLYYTCCAPAVWYGSGPCGFFVALFIYSKLAELVDTMLLLLGDKPVIALQWWHHSTVLLYCWHSYSARIATGLWFAAMNYSVHSVMYGYFAIMTTKYSKYVKPYAIYITLAQLLQMLVGMFVTIKAVFWQIEGKECNVNKTNSVLGLAMYASYFVLFAILFVDNYITKKRKQKNLPKEEQVSAGTMARQVSGEIARKMSHDEDDETEKKKTK
eukprot:TRINITY_DN64326_c0_g1_i1.p1 TRINITY_DN64326_c0_g1~~TRINITY_DN64326_c0_g1_i1.p1  ORF type:complete len:358 (-),score=80.09 TRINITY_DN64326_c0_g1_i1:338-1342(-)